jgi:hypothetical protein
MKNLLREVQRLVWPSSWEVAVELDLNPVPQKQVHKSSMQFCFSSKKKKKMAPAMTGKCSGFWEVVWFPLGVTNLTCSYQQLVHFLPFPQS